MFGSASAEVGDHDGGEACKRGDDDGDDGDGGNDGGGEAVVEFGGGGGSALEEALGTHEGSLDGLETGDDLVGKGAVQAGEGEARGKIGDGKVGGSVGDELEEVGVWD